ncbi:MAG: response regulator [Chloroflexi bacterium]|nr:response regulator [Chloroflexota bacterium]
MEFLVVEDDPHMLAAEIVGLELRWPEATVRGVTTGEAALRAIRNQHPDVVLLDVRLPDKTGLEVLYEIRQQSDVPVLLVTECDEEYARVVGHALGATDFLPKPVSSQVLIERVTAALNGSTSDTADA